MKLFLQALFIVFFVVSCTLTGIHRKGHNPKKEGKPLTYTEERELLGKLSYYRSCYDVYYYDLDLEIFPQTKSLKGKVQIHAKAQNDFDTLQIDLHPNFTIHSLKDPASGEELNFNRRERAVFVANPQKKGNSFVMSIHYSGKPVIAKKPPWKGGFVWKKDKNKNPWIGVACESAGASIWWPLKDHTSDEPDSMRLHYTVPSGLKAIGNGRLEKHEKQEKKEVFHWFISYPINTYNVTVYVGDYKKIKDQHTSVNGINMSLNHYVLPNNFEKAKTHFLQLNPILKRFEQRFGEYPWVEDGFKLVESPYAGMEHQTAIAYGNGYKDGFNGTDYIILHETAHEWWGNSVTAFDLADAWIHEGFATYAESLFFELEKGKEAYKQQLYFSKLFIKNKYPLVSEMGKRQFHFRINSDVYGKGAWVLHTLRKQIKNDTLFFELLKTFSTQNKAKVVTSKDFIEHVNLKTRKDYGWFFDQYLYKNEIPEIHYYMDQNGLVHYRWANVSKSFNKLKVHLMVGLKQIELIPTTETQSYQTKNEYRVSFAEDVLIAQKKTKFK